MQPNIEISILAIVFAIVLNIILGMLWYSPLMFEKIWAKESNIDPSKKISITTIIRAFVLGIIGYFLTAYVMLYHIQIWQPSSWNLTGYLPFYVYGFCTGFFSWLGLQIPIMLKPLQCEGPSFKLFAIEAGHQFVSLQITSMIIAYLTKQ